MEKIKIKLVIGLVHPDGQILLVTDGKRYFPGKKVSQLSLFKKVMW